MRIEGIVLEHHGAATLARLADLGPGVDVPVEHGSRGIVGEGPHFALRGGIVVGDAAEVEATNYVVHCGIVPMQQADGIEDAKSENEIDRKV